MELAVTKVSEENLALRHMAREFAESEIRPISADRDRIVNPHETICWDVIRKGSALGLRTLAVPERFGGPGVDLMGQTLVILELARGDGGIAKTFSQCWKWTPMITELATEEQRKRFLPPFMEDDTYLLGMGSTEPDAGSDNRWASNDPKLGLKLSAVRQGNDWMLNGMKHFIANGGVAKLYVIMTRTDPTVPLSRGATMFFVPSDTPGFRIGRTHDKVGWRSYQNAELIFENCRIPDANRLGEVNKGKNVRQENVSGFNDVELAANMLGMAQAAFEHAIEHARNRVQGGRPIIEHQGVALKLADMYMRLEAGRGFLFRVVDGCMEHGHAFDPASKQLLKVFTTEACIKVAQQAVEIFGGMGVMREAPVEKIMRDMSVFLHLASDVVHVLAAAQKLP